MIDTALMPNVRGGATTPLLSRLWDRESWRPGRTKSCGMGGGIDHGCMDSHTFPFFLLTDGGLTSALCVLREANLRGAR